MSILIQTIAAFFATLFFAIIFNISKTELIPCGILGSLGWFIYIIFLPITNSVVFSVFISALVVSLLALLLAKKRKMPVTIFLVSGIIPLVPGAGMYKTMYATTISKDLSEASYYGVESLQIAGVIAIAIAFSLSFMNNSNKSIKKNK